MGNSCSNNEVITKEDLQERQLKNKHKRAITTVDNDKQLIDIDNQKLKDLKTILKWHYNNPRDLIKEAANDGYLSIIIQKIELKTTFGRNNLQPILDEYQLLLIKKNIDVDVKYKDDLTTYSCNIILSWEPTTLVSKKL
jgi:hypothetical protein